MLKQSMNFKLLHGYVLTLVYSSCVLKRKNYKGITHNKMFKVSGVYHVFETMIMDYKYGMTMIVVSMAILFVCTCPFAKLQNCKHVWISFNSSYVWRNGGAGVRGVFSIPLSSVVRILARNVAIAPELRPCYDDDGRRCGTVERYIKTKNHKK